MKGLLLVSLLFSSLAFGKSISGQVVLDDRETLNVACPDLVTEDFESFALDPFPALPGFFQGEAPATILNGSVDYTDSALSLLLNVDAVDPSNGFLVTSNFMTVQDSITLTLNAPANHFGIDHIGFPGSSAEFFDAGGSSVGVLDLSTPANDTPNTLDDDDFSFSGWIAPEGVTFSSIKITFGNAADGGQRGGVLDNLSTGLCVTQDTCFDLITDVKLAVGDLLANSTGQEAYKLQGAYNCLCAIQDPVFWESDNRLTQYGSTFFVGAAYTVAWLEWSDNPEVAPIIVDFLDALECIVDSEIAYAIANGGNDCYIDVAEAYLDVAEYFEECDRPIISVLAFRLSWLYAYYSTY